MWKYLEKDEWIKLLLSFDLLPKTWDDKKKLRCLYTISNNAESHYEHFKLQKQNGGTRHILAPKPLLKNIQKKILHNILEHIPISNYAKAYRKNISIKDNVIVHLNKKVILKMDIKNFFENIDFYMIYKNVFPTIYFPPQVASILTYLCTYDEFLPQGAPTSSAISNIVMKSFDEYIGKWCKIRNINYTRYSDDLTFSGDFDIKKVKYKVQNFLRKMGFEINVKKTQILKRNNRQIITGIVVNKKMQVPKINRKKLRQEIHYIEKYGIYSHLKKINSMIPPNKYLLSIIGKINFILNINPQDKILKDKKKQMENIYCNF